MKRSLLPVLLTGVLFLGGCGNHASDPEPGRTAVSVGARPLDGTSSKPHEKSAAKLDDEIAMTEEESPFWTVVGGTLGLFAAVIVGILMAGGI